MYLYHLAIRAKSADDAEVFCRRSRQLLATALRTQPGFVHGVCVVDDCDPQSILVYEEWGGKTSVDAWLKSDQRRQIHQDLMSLTEGPDSWKLSIYHDVW